MNKARLIKKKSYHMKKLGVNITFTWLTASKAVILAVTAAAATAAAVGIELGHVGWVAASGGVTAWKQGTIIIQQVNKPTINNIEHLHIIL